MELGHLASVNRPYSGTIVPAAFIEYPSVSSIMIEVNRSLYMDERTGAKNANFTSVKEQIHILLTSLTKATVL